MSKKSVIIMGGGIAGLTAAALLSKRGHPVTLLEKEETTGGFVTGFERDGFYFDATGAFLAPANPGSAFDAILTELGINQELDFLALAPSRNIYPGLELQLDQGNQAVLMETLARHFPEQAKGLAAYSRLCARAGRQFLAFTEAPPWRKALMPIFYPTLFRCARHSHATILDRFFKGQPALIQALSALPTTLPPSRLSFLFVALLRARELKDGIFYPRGGMQKVTELLRRAVVDHGGTIRTQEEISAISNSAARVEAVTSQTGALHQADWFIGAMNPFHGQAMLQGGARLYDKAFDLSRYTISPSALLFHVALPASALPANWPPLLCLHTSADPEIEAKAIAQGIYKDGLHLVITTPSLLNPDLAPEGHHALKVLVHAPGASVFAEEFPDQTSIDKVEQDIFAVIKEKTGVDLAAHNLFTMQTTPQDLMARTGNEEGAMYGLDAALGQVGARRPPLTTNLANLLWIGHYNHPGHGIVGSALSGSLAADMISNEK